MQNNGIWQRCVLWRFGVHFNSSSGRTILCHCESIEKIAGMKAQTQWNYCGGSDERDVLFWIALMLTVNNWVLFFFCFFHGKEGKEKFKEDFFEYPPL